MKNLGKKLKRLVLVMAVVIANVNTAFGQETFVATLEHNGEYRNFYNSTALAAAYEAAQDGDVITLSSGSFSCPTIAKSVTIRGVGLGQLVKNGKKTSISNNFEVYAPNSTCVVNLEGLYLFGTMDIYSDGSTGTAGAINIIKTRCGNVNVKDKNTASAETTPEVLFYSCWLENQFLTSNSSYTNVKVLNSYITGNCATKLSEVSNATFKNCYFADKASSNFSGMNYSTFENCLMIYRGYMLSSYAIAINSVSIALGDGYSTNPIFKNVAHQENCTSIAGVPSDLSTVFSDKENFILQEEFAQKYLGTDGKEVGMHGGIGYTTKMRYPVISNMNISNNQTTTRDGKLEVTIEMDE